MGGNKSIFKLFVPGILMAMTGVGVGDLATGGFAGMKLGVAILWAVLLGAAFKFVLTEGLTRWQLATGTTLLAGSLKYLGLPFFILFGLYFFMWSYFVGAALISASGVAATALFGLAPSVGLKAAFGIAHSLAAVFLIIFGGYKFFVRVMEFLAVLLFVSVVICAIAVSPSWSEVLSGILIPSIPDFSGSGMSWTIALMGGVGGTLTILCYGYWILDEGRESWEDLPKSRIDLGVGYMLTAIFGIGMVIIGSQVTSSGKGLGLLLSIGNHLNSSVGEWAKIVFLVGAWGAIFSSLLGVWQAVPMLFVDWISYRQKQANDKNAAEKTAEISKSYRDKWYKIYLLILATIPALSLFLEFKSVQKLYSFYGALFMPFVAILLLYLNNRSDLLGKDKKNGWFVNLILVCILLFFGAMAVMKFMK